MTYISDAEFAAMIGQDSHYVQQMRSDGRGPVYLRLSGRRCVYDKEAVVRWIAENTIDPTARNPETEQEPPYTPPQSRGNGRKRLKRGYRRVNGPTGKNN